MATSERVARFGTERLKLIYENMLEEDFRQEYECEFIDEAAAFITWDEIKGCQDQSGELFWLHGRDVDEALAAIEGLAARGYGHLVAGMDIGRRRDLTEIVVLERAEGQLKTRLILSLADTNYADQEAVLYRLLDRLPLLNPVLIDQTGIGSQLAERAAQRYGLRAQGIEFTSTVKELLAVEARRQFQNRTVIIPADRELAYQIHSIKRHVTAAKNVVYDAERSEHGHADRFWALALAIWAARGVAAEVAGVLIRDVDYHAQRRRSWA